MVALNLKTKFALPLTPYKIMTILAITGHRPDKLPGQYDLSHPFYSALEERLREIITEVQPVKAFSGMALGVDQFFAELCTKLGIPWVAAIPFVGQERIWPEESKQKYQEILSHATEVVIVTPGNYAAYKMQIRNQYMVDNCDKLIAVWDGTAGGTGNCVQYAFEKKKQIIRVNPQSLITHE